MEEYNVSHFIGAVWCYYQYGPMYTDLPYEFRKNYFRNQWYETMFFTKITKITKRFDADGNYINIYDYTHQKRKERVTHKLRYNTLISLFEINTTRYPNWNAAFEAMQHLETEPPL
jgi:hypothetical protein